MAGLDTRGMADGFYRGYGFVDGIYRRDRAEERQGVLDAENRDYRQKSYELQDRQSERADKQLEMTAQAREQAQKNADRTYELQQDANQFSKNRYYTDRKDQKSKEDEQKDLKKITIAYQRLSSGAHLNEQDMALFEQYPSLSPLNFLDPKTSSSIKYMADNIKSGTLKTDKDILRFANSPQSLDAFNAIYGRQINKGDGGSKRIVNVYPGSKPGMLAFELEITKEDGTKYTAPMTANRGTTDDDQVKEVNIGDVSKQLYGFNTLNMLTQNLTPEVKQKLNAFASTSGMIPTSTNKRRYLQPEVDKLVSNKQNELKALYESANDPMLMGDQKDQIGLQISAAERELEQLLNVSPRPQPPADGGGEMDALPDPAQHKGRTIRDTTTGKRLVSDGANWVAAE
ncbi:hypothetical protein [uncultured Amphritea sp.]|uniref:hypothetical protein n=1 Tax=uncultured Amphritea sp. TaxID=981605 RepID=UPI00260FB136|nr:hypothetical protein [uncultured Amphritea sp.]